MLPPGTPLGWEGKVEGEASAGGRQRRGKQLSAACTCRAGRGMHNFLWVPGQGLQGRSWHWGSRNLQRFHCSLPRLGIGPDYGSLHIQEFLYGYYSQIYIFKGRVSLQSPGRLSALSVCPGSSAFFILPRSTALTLRDHTQTLFTVPNGSTY